MIARLASDPTTLFIAGVTAGIWISTLTIAALLRSVLGKEDASR